ncbi:hypothetical protein FC789_13075 [Clostridium botulinum]|nr:hypothetical protein [Clostridium botulinum]
MKFKIITSVELDIDINECKPLGYVDAMELLRGDADDSAHNDYADYDNKNISVTVEVIEE